MNEQKKYECNPAKVKFCFGPTGPQGVQGTPGIQGVTGLTGATGPSFSIDSILVGYDGTQTIASNTILSLGTLINSTGNSLVFNAPDQIIINNPGTYLLNFSSIINNAGTVGDLGVSLQINGVIIGTASEYIPNQPASFSSELQHSFVANVGDIISLINISPVSNNYHDNTLSIIKLT